MHRSFAAASLALLIWPASALGQSAVPEANPARPTVATPATLTPVGYLQFETGALYAEDSGEFSGRIGLEQTTKLTVHPRLQFLLQSEPVAYSGQHRDRHTDPGDVLGGVQLVLLPGKEARPTLSVAYINRLRTGTATDLDTGSFERSLLLLLSEDLHGFHFDINGMFNEQPDNHVRRGQFGQTVSTSHRIKAFTIAGELWHFTQPLLRGNAIGNLWALSYQARPNLVFDAGFNHGLTSTSTRWETFAGFTYLLPHRLWKSKGSDPGETGGNSAMHPQSATWPGHAAMRQ